MLEVRDLEVGYGESLVVQGASLRVSEGQVVAVLGRNGVGKSTLLRGITGLTPPRGGRVLLRGEDISPLVRRHLGPCLLSSSSLAVGLTIQIRLLFPTYAASVTGIVLAAVLIFEVIGPVLTRRALIVTGEATTVPAPLDEARIAADG